MLSEDQRAIIKVGIAQIPTDGLERVLAAPAEKMLLDGGVACKSGMS